MLAPPIFTLIEANEGAISIMDTSEEESSEKIEKDAEEKILQFDLFFVAQADAKPRKLSSTFYLDKDGNYLQKILLPPPKHSI